MSTSEKIQVLILKRSMYVCRYITNVYMYYVNMYCMYVYICINVYVCMYVCFCMYLKYGWHVPRVCRYSEH